MCEFANKPTFGLLSSYYSSTKLSKIIVVIFRFGSSNSTLYAIWSVVGNETPEQNNRKEKERKISLAKNGRGGG